MTRYLVDSDGVMDYLNGFAPTVALLQELYRQGDDLCTCDIVLAEVYSGLRPHEVAQAEQLLSTLYFLPTSPQAARQAGSWRYTYARRGIPLSVTDCLIAAVASEHGATLLTRNVADYPMPEVATMPLPKPVRQQWPL